MTTKLFWRVEERTALKERLFEGFLADPLMDQERAMMMAQEALPPQRRRSMANGAIYRYKDMIREAREKARDARAKMNTVAAAAPATPLHPMPLDVTKVAEVLDSLMNILADKVAERVAERIAFSAPTQAPLRVKHNPEPASTDRAARTGVLVVGLLPSQMQTVLDKFKHLDLTCLTSDEALKRDPLLRAQTVLMTKFISHAIQEKYRKAPSLRLCNGGVSELSEILSSIT